jgi:hypothetical protein
MIKQFCTRSGWPRFFLAACVLGSLFLVVLVAAGCGDDPPPRLTPAQRKELERQAGELFNAGIQLHQRGEVGLALEKTK